MRLLLSDYLGACSYLVTKCGDDTAPQAEEATTTVEHKRAPIKEVPPQKARPGFGAPGQFSEPTTAESDAEGSATEGEIRTIPAPVPTEVTPTSEAVDSSGAA